MEKTLSRKGIKWISKAEKLYDIKSQIKNLYEKADLLMEELKELSNNKSAFGGNFLFMLSFRKGGIDYEVIPELKQVDLEQYRKEQVAMWKLDKIEKEKCPKTGHIH